ncbi:hypothetical protein [Sphingosinicella sp. BN140058]|uniref:hypothetical protein n=1 Tax=Sphingosinicella sp. BN140058 TaxID=1892855 RepID=UPI001011E55A|nr:hypothetical protein [Sphingosinicella sp. BN140058]QAY80343.1 hypothetical protein ETR14_27250 [Sphingosinicella sp. BN140058]
MKKIVAALLPLALVAGCGLFDDGEGKVYGPEDYSHFSSFFSMNESSAKEMTVDGGNGIVAPTKADPVAAQLSARAPIGDATAAALTAQPADSPAVGVR